MTVKKVSPMKASDFERDLNDFLKEYQYQPSLTAKLDDLHGVVFSQSLINEIVLWKLDRYVSLDAVLVQRVESLHALLLGQYTQGRSVLKALLVTHGVDLPMASTILRFRNPEVFQIIDRHAYRAIYGADYPLYPNSPGERKMEVYFNYLDELVDFCEKRGLIFMTIDRLLYVFDKSKNGTLRKIGQEA
jgi:hypothetical protein